MFHKLIDIFHDQYLHVVLMDMQIECGQFQSILVSFVSWVVNQDIGAVVE